MIKEIRQLFCNHVFIYRGVKYRKRDGAIIEYHDLFCEKCGKLITVKNLSNERKDE